MRIQGRGHVLPDRLKEIGIPEESAGVIGSGRENQRGSAYRAGNGNGIVTAILGTIEAGMGMGMDLAMETPVDRLDAMETIQVVVERRSVEVAEGEQGEGPTAVWCKVVHREIRTKPL